MKYKNAEWVPLVDEEGNVKGHCPRPLVHNGSLWLHPVVHLHVINDGKLLLQLRPKTKKIQPGKWDTAVGGHIDAGESLEAALKREVWEEIGLSNFNARLMTRYVWQCPVEHEYVFSFVTSSMGPFVTKNVGEVDELKFWSSEEIRSCLGKDVFTPNLEKELVDWILPNINSGTLV
ncbi:MAG: NUDIX domain-containing protein [Bacteroidales bacterium]|nr:NUDIX domain-containing protein [Bacteroidales bacterium]